MSDKLAEAIERVREWAKPWHHAQPPMGPSRGDVLAVCDAAEELERWRTRSADAYQSAYAWKDRALSAERERDEASARCTESEAQVANALEIYDESRAILAGIERLLREGRSLDFFLCDAADNLAAAVQAALEELDRG